MVDIHVALATTHAPERNREYVSLKELGARAAQYERDGYDGVYVAETNIDPFVALAPVAAETSSVTIGTSVAVALARSPMTLAHTAHHLQALSGGRLMLGVGSQVKAHITRRFSMPWDKPAKHMEAHIETLRAIWHAWRTYEPLDIHNDYYSIDLTNPMFVPPEQGCPDPTVMLAAVGPAVTGVACRVADGIICHPLITADYARQDLVPRVKDTLQQNDRSGDEFSMVGRLMIATGETDEELERSVEALRARIAFYASTPAYHDFLAHLGVGDLTSRLHALSTTRDPDKWSEMARLVPDRIVEEIGLVCSPQDVIRKATERFGDTMDVVQTVVM